MPKYEYNKKMLLAEKERYRKKWRDGERLLLQHDERAAVEGSIINEIDVKLTELSSLIESLEAKRKKALSRIKKNSYHMAKYRSQIEEARLKFKEIDLALKHGEK